jgi:hypothetical protein
MRLLRTLRGILGTALVWAVCWTPAGMALWAFQIGGHVPLDWWVFIAGHSAQRGATGGALFASAVALAERRRSLDSLAPARLAVWGALAALAEPVTTMLEVHFRHPEVHIGAAAFVGAAVAAVLGAGYGRLTLSAALRGRPVLDDPRRTAPEAGSLTGSRSRSTGD